MSNQPSIAIIGIGAIGGYVATQLVKLGLSVNCLLNSDYDYVKEHGLTLNDECEHSNEQISVHAFNDVQQMPKADYVLVAFKTTSNHLLQKLLPPILKPNTKIVLLQNGIGMEQALAEDFPRHNIIGASCIIKAVRAYPGIINYYGLKAIYFAPLVATEDVSQLVKIFTQAGFETGVNTLDIMRWQKLVANIPLNGLAVVLNATTSELCANPESRALVLRLTQEVIDAAKASGAELAKDYYQQRVESLKKFQHGNLHSPSMKYDYDTKRPMELEVIYANPLKIAAQHGFAMPLTEMLYQQLCFLQKQYLN